MNAVDPVRKMRPLSAESRVLRRGVLGDKVDGRSREGRFLLQIERELTRQIGEPSFTQRMLIRRMQRALLRLELLDEKLTAGTLTDHDGRTFGALSNQVRLIARELGVKASPERATPSIASIVARHKAASS